MERKARSEMIAAERRTAIREAARRVFARRGYSEAATDEIAREAGVSPGLVFHYFKNKKELLVEVVAPLAVGSLSRSLSEVADEPVEDALFRFLQSHGEFMMENADLLKVVFYEAQFHEEVRELVLGRLLGPGTATLGEYFRRQMATGRLRPDLDVPVVARSFVGLLGSLIVFREVLQDPVYQERPPEAALRELVRLFLQGVRSEGGTVS